MKNQINDETDPFDEAIAEDLAKTSDEWSDDEPAVAAAPDSEVTLPSEPTATADPLPDEPEQANSQMPVDEPPAVEAEPPRMEYAADPGAPGMSYEQAVTRMGEDFGAEFVDMLKAIIGHCASEEAGKVGGATGGRLDQLIGDIQEGFRSLHGDTLRALRSNVDDVAASPEFAAYIEGLPEPDRSTAQSVIGAGRLPEVVKLIDAFEDSRKATDEGDDDDWEGVKSMPAMPASISSDDPNDFGDEAEWGRDVLRMKR